MSYSGPFEVNKWSHGRVQWYCMDMWAFPLVPNKGAGISYPQQGGRNLTQNEVVLIRKLKLVALL
jgi:hypothetical protein